MPYDGSTMKTEPNMIRRLLCFLGYHPEDQLETLEGNTAHKTIRCKACGRTEVISLRRFR
jgi:hypothetical protein